MPRIATISIVRHESDILETFVRHHAPIAARMHIVLHRADAATRSIAERLRDEGLPLDLREESVPHYPQEEVMNALLSECAARGDIDLILPLDADEFLSARGMPLADALDALPMDRPSALLWHTYVPLPSDDSDPHPLRRVTHRRAVEPMSFRKIAVPAAVARRGARLIMGNHALIGADGTDIAAAAAASLSIAHFPVRSEAQLRAKVLTGWTSHLRNPRRVSGQIFQWEKLFVRCSDPAPIASPELLEIALDYASQGDVALVCDPVATFAQAPRYGEPAPDPWVLAGRRARVRAAASAPSWPALDAGAAMLADRCRKLLSWIAMKRHGIDTDTLAQLVTLLAAVPLHERPAGDATLSAAGALIDEAENAAPAPELPLEAMRREAEERSGGLPFLCTVYEYFLGKLHPGQCGGYGVCYTPLQLARASVRFADDLLAAAGLRRSDVHIIDPACGTGALLLAASERAEHDAPMTGIDILPVPPLLAGAALRSGGMRNARVTCDDALAATMPPFGGGATPVILCNPPYNQFWPSPPPPESIAARTSAVYIDASHDPGLDLYIQFVALAHGIIRAAGRGLAVMVVPREMLFSPAHVPLRRALLADMSHVRILDLHGDGAGAGDGNVFTSDVALGVCLLLFARLPDAPHVLQYAELRGSTASKHVALAGAPTGMHWTALDLLRPDALFAPTSYAAAS